MKKKRAAKEWEAAFGWVMEKGGALVKQGSMRIFANSPTQAEAYILLYAVKEVPLGEQNVQFRTDATALVRALKIDELAPMEIVSIMKDAKVLLVSFNYCMVSKVSRNLVSNGHNLAVAARNGN